ncbi:MAG: hypothetical protein HY348_02845 [Nitrospira defluvii]|nr:hypothetical protein [Nitrospira defluvii]
MGSRSRTLAKLTPPTLPVVLKRLQLFRLLDKSRTRPLTWITALPGAGKTTLVASYLKARRLPVCWYRLDESDADPSSFFHNLSIAAKVLAPRYRRPLPILTSEYAMGLPTFARRFFRELCARLPGRCVLVLDNYQELSATAALHQLLCCAIQEVPRSISMIVMSRQTFPAAMAKLEADRTLSLIGPERLELSKAEARAIVLLHTRQRPGRSTKAFVDALYRQMGGWAAGIVLMLEHAQGRDSALSAQAGKTPDVVFQYLAGEVLERLAPEVQQLLLKTSILSDISVPLAERLSKLSHAGELLASLHASRYFTERRQGQEPWYRYHALFRDFLRHRARQAFSAAELRALQQTAARELVQAGRIEDGVVLLQEAEDWKELGLLILAQTETLIAEGRIQTLEGWIRSIPETTRDDWPWLTFWLGTTRMPFNPDEAYVLFERVFEQFRACGDYVGILLAWSGAVQSVLFRWADMDRLTKWMELFPVIHPEGTSYPSIKIEAQVTISMASAIVMYQPDRPDTRVWLGRAQSLIDHLPPALLVGTRYMFDVYYLWVGDIPAAERGLTQFRNFVRTRPAAPMAWILYHVMEAVLGWYKGEFDQCREAVRKARAIANESGVHIWDPLILGQATYAELFAGNLALADDLLRAQAAVVERTGGIYEGHFEFLKAWLLWLQGDSAKAWAHMDRSIEIFHKEGNPKFPIALSGALAASILSALGRGIEAAHWLNRVRVIGEEMESDHLRFGAWMISAHVAFERGDETAGRDALRKGLSIGQARGLIQHPGWDPRTITRLCAQALKADLAVPFVHRLIRTHNLKPGPESMEMEAWPWPVKIYTLGKFEILIDGQPLEKKRKAPHRLLELLAAIIAFGGQAVPVSRLTDALWPEVDGDQAQENFKKSMTRLRHLLGVENVIQWQDGKVSLNGELCWVDALSFDALVKQADTRAATAGSNKHVQHDSRAAALYTGPFLGLEDCPSWAVPYRDRLRDRYVTLILRHCDELNRKDKTTEVVHCLEQAIEVDPVAEPLYQRLIPILASNGRQTEAAALYHRCRKAVAAHLGSPPSADLERAYAALRKPTSR